MDNLKDKSVLVMDWGLTVELALKLAEKFGRVYYFTNWADAFPSSNKAQIGRGLEKFGVYKVDYFWEYVDEVDLICFFDTYGQDVIEYLRGKGKRVFGAGMAEYLETNRKYGREVQKNSGLPTQESKVVKGLKALGDEIKKSGDYFVKLNAFRGDIETFYAKDYQSSKIYLDALSVSLGPRQDDIEFMLEKKIEGIEPGYDGLVVDGKYSSSGMWGYEKKGSGFIGQTVKNEDVPEGIKLVNDKLSSFFAGMKTRSFWSSEVMVDKNKTGYLIDPTVRVPQPVGLALHTEIWKNLPEFIWAAGNGELIDLIPAYKYGCGTALASDWAGEHWLEVTVDPAVRQYIKFRALMMQGDKYFIVPGPVSESVCSVIGLGNTVDEAVEHLRENIKGVSGFELDADTGGIDNVIDEIKQGAAFGLPDFTAGGK
jgi:hypothetical protein